MIIEYQYTISFDTKLTSSSKLGINTGHPYRFQRSATCYPIRKENYITELVENGLVKYRYFYGKRTEGSKGDWTWGTIGDPFNTSASGYQLK
jgi:hypothetical protein